MLNKIAKIANKLDRLGLTKEADVLDRYIGKIAGETSYSGWSPKNADLMEKWFKGSLDGGFLGAFTATLPTANIKSVRTAIGEIERVLNEISSISENAGERFNFIDWYTKNIDSCLDRTPGACHNKVSDKLTELADKITEISTSKAHVEDVYDMDTHQKAGKLSELYAPVVKDLRSAAAAWKASYNKMDAPEKKEAPEAPMAQHSGDAYPPKSTQNPWSAVSPELKKAWLDRAAAKKKDPSYSNFQLWLKLNNLVGASDQQIISLLRVEPKKNPFQFSEAVPEVKDTPGWGTATDKQRGI